MTSQPGMPIVPHEWTNEYRGESEPGEVWTLEVEHDLMKDGHPFVVTVVARQDDDEGHADTCICLCPQKAREVATALLVYAHLAEQENERRGLDV